MTSFDIIVIGGGMAGMSIAAHLAADARVAVLEAEEVPGYHATGRSVAFWTESYGGPSVQPLTSASGPLLGSPDPDFSEAGFLTPRGAVHVGRDRDAARARDFAALFDGQGVDVALLDRAAIAAAVPGVRGDWTHGVAEPSCADIDAAALLAAYRRRFLRLGGALLCDRPLRRAVRSGGVWQVETGAGGSEHLSADILVDAAGAWADGVASACGAAPLGIAPFRRTVVQLRTDPPTPDALPLVIGLDDSFYFKSAGAGRLWLTPHDEVPQPPGDAAPDDVAVATAIERLREVVDWDVVAVERKWAGLRSFAPDRAPVYGYDAATPGFFWFAGQGGFGIQTAPAAALIGAALLRGGAMPDAVRGVDVARYLPGRFAAGGV